jgi:hypothetical protein
VAQIAIERHARLSRIGVVEASGRQRAQRDPLLGQALVHGETPGGVQAAVADSLAPVAVLLIKVFERRDPPGRPKASL